MRPSRCSNTNATRPIRASANSWHCETSDMACTDTTVLLLIGAVILAAASGVLLGLLHLRNRKD